MEVENNATYLEKSNALSYSGYYLFRRLDWVIDDSRGRDIDEKLVQKLFSPPSARRVPVPFLQFMGPELSSHGRRNGGCSGCSFREV